VVNVLYVCMHACMHAYTHTQNREWSGAGKWGEGWGWGVCRRGLVTDFAAEAARGSSLLRASGGRFTLKY